jgi:hypothetical protein
MGEGSSFSQEAMNREVDLLISISDSSGRTGRSQRGSTTEDGVQEGAAAEAEAAASD